MQSGITDAQRRKLFALIKELGSPREQLISFTIYYFDKEHVTELTKKEASELIDILSGEWKSEAPGMITEAQKWAILGLAELLGWDENSIAKFIRNHAKVAHMQWLTKKSASNIIEGMKKICSKDMDRKEAREKAEQG